MTIAVNSYDGTGKALLIARYTEKDGVVNSVAFEKEGEELIAKLEAGGVLHKDDRKRRVFPSEGVVFLESLPRFLAAPPLVAVVEG